MTLTPFDTALASGAHRCKTTEKTNGCPLFAGKQGSGCGRVQRLGGNGVITFAGREVSR